MTTGTINSNTITGWSVNNGRALYCSAVNYLTVTGNTFTNNNDGISIFGGSTFITINQNTLNNNLRYGINIKGADISISNNSITGNYEGVKIDVNVIPTERVHINNNDLSGNTNYDVESTTTVTGIVDATCNWYGTILASVIASKITGPVNFTPFLISASGPCNGPTPITTIQTPTLTPGSLCGTYDVPVMVQNFTNIGAISLVLNFDPSVFAYQTPGVTLNPAIASASPNISIPG